MCMAPAIWPGPIKARALPCYNNSSFFPGEHKRIPTLTASCDTNCPELRGSMFGQSCTSLVYVFCLLCRQIFFCEINLTLKKNKQWLTFTLCLLLFFIFTFFCCMTFSVKKMSSKDHPSACSLPPFFLRLLASTKLQQQDLQQAGKICFAPASDSLLFCYKAGQWDTAAGLASMPLTIPMLQNHELL